MARPSVVCITPVRNESWILEKFLRCASLWADHIIVADQHSDDGSREIAARFDKVTLIDNTAPGFNEPERQKLLLEAARRIGGPKLIVALDADEFLSANVLASPEWDAVLAAPPRTVFTFDWPTVLANAERYWTYPQPMPLAFMDDGVAEHVGRTIHSPRVPMPADAPRVHVEGIAVMHFVGTDERRWKSKMRWYQCWSALNQPERGMLDIFCFHHKDLFVPDERIRRTPDEWLDGYRAHGIDLRVVEQQRSYRWDGEVLRLFAAHGAERFRRLNIWDVDWNALSSAHGGAVSVRDPRSVWDRLALAWLTRNGLHVSQHFRPSMSLAKRLELSVMYRVLRRCGW